MALSEISAKRLKSRLHIDSRSRAWIFTAAKLKSKG